MIDGAINHTVSSGGVNLAVTEAGNRQGPTLVFVHGYPDTRQLWRPIFERPASST